MPPSPEDCSFRTPLGANESGAAICGLVSRVTGITDAELCLAQRDACEACSRSMRQAALINPVVASLIYHAAARVIEAGGHRQCSVAHAKKLRRCALDQSELILDEIPDRSFPPQRAADHAEAMLADDSAPGCAASLSWTVGLLTAPRAQPTIRRTIQSLQQAGFGDLQVFAEPGSWLPPECNHLPVTVHQRRLGNFVNFYSSLCKLLTESPRADTFAMFQDDIEAAADLKEWCDRQLWPLDAGVVSLFTPRLHGSRTPGWRLLSPGYRRVCGAQALVFRRQELERFLSDPLVLNHLRDGRHFDDAVLAGWVARQGLGIAYHTPSLVQHIGAVSSIFAHGPDPRNVAHAVSAVDQIAAWSPPVCRQATIGLVGWNTPTGLGYQNRDLAAQLNVDRWLIPPHPRLAPLGRPPTNARLDAPPHRPDDGQLKEWLRGLDWVLFVERPFLENLVQLAAHSGVGVACVPNWEWLRPDLRWLGFVDLMLCPTRQTLLQMTDWKRRYGFGWDAVYVPWPVDGKRFRFQQRHTCRRFLFVNGWGGASQRLDGSPLPYGRKGLELVLETARLAPHLSFVVYSQVETNCRLPANIELRSPPADNADLYRDGDVCLQPSHYEGLGLQLLECQAAGLPLVTTDSAPMNEYQPLRTIPVQAAEIINVGGGPVLSQLMSSRDLVNTLEPLVQTNIHEASRRAREFIARQHSWDTALEILCGTLIKR